MTNFLVELKRRNVYKVAVAYAVVAWLLIQAASILFPTFEAPGWAMKVFVAIVAAGFPVALVLAWAFELTPEGVQRASASTAAPLHGTRSRRRMFWTCIAIGLLTGVVFSFYLLRVRGGALRQAAGVTSRRAVAVLPFENLSEDKANSYFTDGMQDEIITRLAKIGHLKVISRTSTLPYRNKLEKLSEIGRQLGVGHVVEGTVQRINDRVRVNVQLVEVATDEHLWAELYDRKISDVFEVQSEVATRIADALRAQLSGGERAAIAQKPTSNLAAYDAYLRGIDLNARPGQSGENLIRAADAFTEAVALDAEFAQAWAALSRAQAEIIFQQVDLTPARKEAARAAAQAATRLSPNSAETLLANAYFRYHVERDYNGARVLFERIRREVPSSSEAVWALARVARRQSRWKESLALYEEAAKLNPRDAHLTLDRAWTFSMLRDDARTGEMIERTLAINPDDPEVLVNKTRFLQVTGDLAGARGALDRIPAEFRIQQAEDIRAQQLFLERRFADAVQFETQLVARRASVVSDSLSALQFLGWAKARGGDAAGAKEAYLEAAAGLEQLQAKEPDNPYIVSSLALTHAGLGNKERALHEAERAVALLPASADPVYGPIFEEYLAQVEAEVGEPARAIARLKHLLSIPYGAFPLSQALLRVDPVWDALRPHPDFKALIEGPEPQTIYN